MSPREAEYKEKGVEILAINALEDINDGKAWLASSGLDMDWAFADESVLEAFGISLVPSQVLIDREGKVIWKSSFSSVMGGADAIFEQLDAAL